MIIYVKRDLQSFKIKPGAPSYIKVPKDEMVSYMFTNPENNPDNADNIKASNLYLWDKFTILNEVKIQSSLVDLDQKIKDMAHNINDYIEFLYNMGDEIESNNLSETMEYIEKAYNFNYSDLSLKNMNFKKKIELYKELKNIQEELK